MATKRMFDKAIIDTDRFMDLPISCKALYFLLGMEADDEGFVSYKKVIKIHGGTDDDINVLLIKNFVIKFPSGVVVITDWNKNNWLDSRRIKPTEYQTEKKMITVNNDKVYTLSIGLASIEESRGVEKSIDTVAEATKENKKKEEKPYSFEEQLLILRNDRREDYKIISFYWKKKGFVFNNQKQFNSALIRELKSAKLLKGYTGEEIGRSIKYCEANYKVWTLETVGKRIADLINKKS